MNAWIVFCIALCVVVLCTQICALILFKRDDNFRVGALCCTEIVLLIQIVMRGKRLFINPSVGLNLTIRFGGTAGGLLYLFLMTVITLDRSAEIKFILKYALYCTTKSAITIVVLVFIISSFICVGLLINFIRNGNMQVWDELLIVYFIPIFPSVFLLIALITYSY